MTPEYRIEIEERIKEYFKSFDDIGQIINIKCEETFSDLGNDVNVWNVKTKTDSYWVVEGENAPMNLYTQNGHYFSADEAYSFHMGFTQRLTKRHNDNFKHIIDEVQADKKIVNLLAAGIKKFSAGKQPAWIDYMSNYNRTHGNFASGKSEEFMVLNRSYEIDRQNISLNQSVIKDLTTYIDPTKFNYIFADQSLDAMNFWVQIGVDRKARRMMSAKVIPNL